MNQIRQIYDKYIRHRLFNKLTVLITAFYLFVLLCIGAMSCAYFQSSLRDTEINYFVRAVDSVNEYLDKIISESKLIAHNFYVEVHDNAALKTFFESDGEEFQKHKIVYYDYLTSLLNQNSNFQKVSLYRITDQALVSSVKGYFPSSERQNLISIETSVADFSGNLPIITSVPNKSHLLRIVIPINEYFVSGRRYGYLIIDLSDSALKSSVDKFTKSIPAAFLILQKDGFITYCSKPLKEEETLTKQIENTPAFFMENTHYPYNQVLIENQPACLLKNDENENGLWVVCLFSMEETYAKTNRIISVILAGVLLTGVFGIVVIYFITNFFSNRVQSLITRIETTRVQEKPLLALPNGPTDEISQIARQFAEVFEERQRYLQQAYTYELRQKAASYQLLQSQVNPHFLFNTLEAIRMKAIEEEANETAELIYAMSTLLRQTLKKDAVHTIAAELRYIDLYLELFKLRYPGYITYKAHCPPELCNGGIPVNLLQPIIENCIVHGFSPTIPDYTIELSLYEEPDGLWFVITDNGLGIPSERLEKLKNSSYGTRRSNEFNNIGLINVNERIHCIYGDAYGITLESTERVSTIVRVHIGKMTVEELKSHVQSLSGG